MRLAVYFKYFTFNSTAVPLHVLELFTTGKIKRNKKCHIHIIYNLKMHYLLLTLFLYWKVVRKLINMERQS